MCQEVLNIHSAMNDEGERKKRRNRNRTIPISSTHTFTKTMKPKFWRIPILLHFVILLYFRSAINAMERWSKLYDDISSSQIYRFNEPATHLCVSTRLLLVGDSGDAQRNGIRAVANISIYFHFRIIRGLPFASHTISRHYAQLLLVSRTESGSSR